MRDRAWWLTLGCGLVLAACQSGAETTEDDGNPDAATGGGGAGGGGMAGAAPACDPYAPRAIVPEVLIGPTGLEASLVGLMDSAQSSIDLMMYQLTCDGCIAGLVAAQNRGVTVRAVLDYEEYNNDAIDALEAAGAQLKDAPNEFNNYHAKSMIIDGATALIMSANMNGYSMFSERNYGVIDRDPQDVADVIGIFERDWAGSGELDLSCTRLIVSPENSRERMVEHIASATESLDLSVMYISDSEVKTAIKTKAQDGVPVRVLLAHPEWISDNTATASELQAAGIPAKFLYTAELHAKLVIADGVPRVGSQNLSTNSIENNREIGVLVTEEAPAAQIVQQFEADWAAGTTP